MADSGGNFVQALSYYKIFGYPTGLGALVARRDALARLTPRYFGGGTAAACAADADFFRRARRACLSVKATLISFWLPLKLTLQARAPSLPQCHHKLKILLLSLEGSLTGLLMKAGRKR